MLEKYKADIRLILFDCMETLVDLYELPVQEDYARWAYEGSGVEGMWKSFSEYFEKYNLSKKHYENMLQKDKEYEMYDRLRYLIELSDDTNKKYDNEYAARALYNNYWKTYKSKCFVKDDVIPVLKALRGTFKLGVVSNFMVAGGIEELLDLYNIRSFFDFTVTSINIGWRKPDRRIYNEALNMASAYACQTLFIGDDYLNDYITPLDMGMKAILLDRHNKYTGVSDRIHSFNELL